MYPGGATPFPDNGIHPGLHKFVKETVFQEILNVVEADRKERLVVLVEYPAIVIPDRTARVWQLDQFARDGCFAESIIRWFDVYRVTADRQVGEIECYRGPSCRSQPSSGWVTRRKQTT